MQSTLRLAGECLSAAAIRSGYAAIGRVSPTRFAQCRDAANKRMLKSESSCPREHVIPLSRSIHRNLPVTVALAVELMQISLSNNDVARSQRGERTGGPDTCN